MKPVNVQTVRDRINLLETAQAETGLLSLAGEFELACLRKLLASLEAKPVAVVVGKLGAGLKATCYEGSPRPVEGSKLYGAPPVPDDLDAKRIAFITSLADDTAPQQFQALATSAGSGKHGE